MPFKHNAVRRRHIPRARYRVTNSLRALLRSWPTYEAGLRRWGDLTVRVNEAALAGWQAPRRSTAGGQPRYSELATELVLTLWLVFHLALRQAEGLAHGVLQLLGMALPVPDHTHPQPAWPRLCRASGACTGQHRAGAPGAGQHGA